MESKATRDAIGQSSEENVRDFINITYNQTVEVLFDAACQTVPRVKANALKFWWDQELKDLKEKAISSNKLWIEAGRPRNGYIFETRKSDKYKYKIILRRKQQEEKDVITNDLHEALLNKNMESME